jgi:hypothetical protein
MAQEDPVFLKQRSLDEIKFQAEKDKWLENWMHLFRLKELGHKSAIDYGIFGLKTITLAHGGALLALITFLQTIWKDKDAYQQKAGQALAFFGAGLTVTLIAIIIGYMAMSFFSLMFEEQYTEKYSKKYERFRIAALVTSILSLICFIGGLCTVHAMLISTKASPEAIHAAFCLCSIL